MPCHDSGEAWVGLASLAQGEGAFLSPVKRIGKDKTMRFLLFHHKFYYIAYPLDSME